MKEYINKTMVAYFGGTGYDFDENGKGYVSPRHLNADASEPASERFVDESFQQLNNHFLHPDQIRFGYDGCHQSGGNFFAFGVDKPCEHLYEKIKTYFCEHTGEDERLTLVLTAHSRGCISTMLFAKKIGLDKTLQNKVDIVFDWRDPVPGNFRIAATLDAAGITTIASQLKNLSDCGVVKEVNVTIQEKGILQADLGFDVLIPTFSNHIDLKIDFLPGLHAVQENNEPKPYYAKKKCYVAHPDLFLLGLCKSLQIYSENGVAINYPAVVGYVMSRLEDANQFDDLLIHSKDTFETFLKNAQGFIYQKLLIDYQQHPEREIITRSVHFGGKFKAVAEVAMSTHLNDRHVLLKETGLVPCPVTFLGFEGHRFDLAKRVLLSKTIDALRKECDHYWIYLNQKSPLKYEKRMTELKALNELIKEDVFAFTGKAAQLRKFQAYFEEHKNIFDESENLAWQDKRFKKNLVYLMASIFTLGGYAIYKASCSYRKRGYAKFWQPRAAVFMNATSEEIRRIEKRMH